MGEYVERKSLLEDIGETVLFSVREGTELPTAQMRGARKVIDRIKSAPVVDAVEVVRCKECKDYSSVMFCGKPTHYGYCCNTHDSVLGNRHRFENDFCSYGEKDGRKG